MKYISVDDLVNLAESCQDWKIFAEDAMSIFHKAYLKHMAVFQKVENAREDRFSFLERLRPLAKVYRENKFFLHFGHLVQSLEIVNDDDDTIAASRESLLFIANNLQNKLQHLKLSHMSLNLTQMDEVDRENLVNLLLKLRSIDLKDCNIIGWDAVASNADKMAAETLILDHSQWKLLKPFKTNYPNVLYMTLIGKISNKLLRLNTQIQSLTIYSSELTPKAMTTISELPILYKLIVHLHYLRTIKPILNNNELRFLEIKVAVPLSTRRYISVLQSVLTHKNIREVILKLNRHESSYLNQHYSGIKLGEKLEKMYILKHCICFPRFISTNLIEATLNFSDGEFYMPDNLAFIPEFLNSLPNLKRLNLLSKYSNYNINILVILHTMCQLRRSDTKLVVLIHADDIPSNSLTKAFAFKNTVFVMLHPVKDLLYVEHYHFHLNGSEHVDAYDHALKIAAVGKCVRVNREDFYTAFPVFGFSPAFNI